MFHQTTLTTIESKLTEQIRNSKNFESMEQVSYLSQTLRFGQTQQALFTTNLEGLITHWTIEISQLFQYSDAEILGKDISILLEKLNHRTFLNLIADVLKNGRSIYKKQTIRRKNGETIDVDFCHSPLRDKEGNIIGIIHTYSTTFPNDLMDISY